MNIYLDYDFGCKDFESIHHESVIRDLTCVLYLFFTPSVLANFSISLVCPSLSIDIALATCLLYKEERSEGAVD